VMCQAVRKLHGHLKAVKEAAVERNLPQAKPITLTPQEQSLDEDLDEAAQVRLLVYNGSYLLVPCFVVVAQPPFMTSFGIRTSFGLQ